MSRETGRDRYVQDSLFISSWKLDVCHGVHKTRYCTCSGIVSTYMNNPGKEYLRVVQWIFNYLRGTTSHALCFGYSNTILQGYVDVDTSWQVIKATGGAP